MQPPQNSGLGSLRYIDAARGIAILMVVLIHTSQSVAGLTGFVARIAELGQMGVQLFFVASAFTLCRAFVQRRGEPRHLVAFFIRRVFRIAPLYYLGIALYFCVFLLKQNEGSVNPYSSTNVLANILFIHGFVPSANNSIVPGGWSIGTEMAFYACFPVLFTILERSKSKGTWALVACIGVALAIDLAFARAFGGQFNRGVMNNSFLYYNLINQLPVFLLGMLAFFLVQEGKEYWILN